VERISTEIERYFRPIEFKIIVPDSEAEFGYFGKHFILIIPTDIYDQELPFGSGPRFFELQIKTLFQHAWAEAEHDLAYKPSTSLSIDQKRRVAFTAAQAWGADMIFEELHRGLAP
jgi:ppGpp synthetase/RelA/SpoT-type nucleotidyltranferase